MVNPIEQPPAVDILGWMARQMVEDAASERMSRLLRAIDEQIARDDEALVKQQERLEQLKDQDAQQRIEKAREAMRDAWVATELEGLIDRAEAGYDVSIPTGVRVTGCFSAASVGAKLAEIGEAEREALDDGARSALWAIENRYRPHASDLADLVEQTGGNPRAVELLRDLGREYDRTGGFQDVRLQAHSGRERLAIGDRQEAALKGQRAESPDRSRSRRVGAAVDAIFGNAA